MAKTFLNQKERNEVLVLASFKVYMEDIATKLEKLNRPKDTIKYARMSKSFCNKVLQSYLKGLDDREIQRVLGESKKLNVSVKYKDEALREFEAIKKMDDVTPVKTDDLIDLCEYALLSCRSCKKRNEDITNCKLRRILFKHEIEPFNFEAKYNECQYYDEREEI